MHSYTRGDTPVKTNTLPFYLVSVLAHIYFKTMLQMILPPPPDNQHFFRPATRCPHRLCHVFLRSFRKESTSDFTRFKTTECSSNKLHIVAINRQVHFKLANTLTFPPHSRPPESPVSMIMHSYQSRCCVN